MTTLTEPIGSIESPIDLIKAIETSAAALAAKITEDR